MAADTMLSAHNQQNRAQKLVRLPDGGVAGACGQWNRAYQALRYLEDGGDPDARDGLPKFDGASVLIARPNGSLWVAEDEFPPFPLLDSVAAIGCGSDAALMAMSLGLSAVDAVSRVTRQDVLCGDPVQSMEIVPERNMPPIKTHTRKARPAKRRRK